MPIRNSRTVPSSAAVKKRGGGKERSKRVEE
jgi:hypothetical protein